MPQLQDGRGSDAEDPDRNRRTSAVAVEIRLAGGLLLVQGGGLVVAGVIVAVKTVAGTAADVGRGLSDAGVALGGAALLAVAAISLLHLSVLARSPVIVIELLALPVGYSLVSAGRSAYGIPLLLSALAILYLLFTPAARGQLQR